MRNIWAICKREVLSFFVSPIAYFVITGFVLLAGYFFFIPLSYYNIIIARYNSMPYYQGGGNAPNLNQFVVEGFYHTLIIILVFLVPLFTMRIIAEEKRRGTFELLLTSPLTVSEVVLGKFLGVAFVIFVMLCLTFLFPLILLMGGDPEIGPVLTGFLAILLCGFGFASIGMAVSSFTENQIVAGVSSMVTLLLLYVIHSPGESLGGGVAQVLEYLSPVMQAREMIKGVISIQGCVYFLSLITLGLFLSNRAIEAYRWR